MDNDLREKLINEFQQYPPGSHPKELALERRGEIEYWERTVERAKERLEEVRSIAKDYAAKKGTKQRYSRYQMEAWNSSVKSSEDQLAKDEAELAKVLRDMAPGRKNAAKCDDE